MESLNLIQKIAVFAIPAIFAITVHEAAHGYVARFFGDRTAEMLGRLTLNPIKHIDPIGTIAVPLGLLAMSSLFGGQPLLFGWAKPVPVAMRNFKKPRQQMAIVAAAGPVSNFVMAAIWTAVLGFSSTLPNDSSVGGFLFPMAVFGIFFNLILALLNMLPLPPLDGGRVLSGFLSPRASTSLDRIEPYGLFIIIGLLATGILSKLISLPVFYATANLCAVAGVAWQNCFKAIF